MRTAKIGPDLLLLVYDPGRFVRHTYHYEQLLRGYHTLGARDFSSAVSGLCRLLVASAYGRRCVGLRPTPKISSAREKNLWYPG